MIRQLVSSQFYWPWYVRFRPIVSHPEVEIADLNGTENRLEDVQIQVRKPNFSRATIDGDKLTFEIFGRKGKALSKTVFSID